MKWINQHVTIQSLFQVIKEGIWSYSVYFPFKQLKRTSIEFKWSSFVIQATKLCASCHLLLLTARIYSGTPLNTDTPLLRTVFLVPSPYIFSKFNSLNKDTFYCPLSVHKVVWLYKDWNFSSFNAMHAKTTKKLWQVLPNGIFYNRAIFVCPRSENARTKQAQQT